MKLVATAFLALSTSLATPAFAGLASLPLGSANVAPCDGMHGTTIDLGAHDTELLANRPAMWLVLEVEGNRQDNANGTMRFTEARAALTRYNAAGPLSSVCLDARSAGAIVLDATGTDLVVRVRRSNADVLTVRSAAQTMTITSAEPSTWSQLIVSPRDHASLSTTTDTFTTTMSATRFSSGLQVIRTALPGGAAVLAQFDLAPELGGNEWDLSGNEWDRTGDSDWRTRPRRVAGKVVIDVIRPNTLIDIAATGTLLSVVRDIDLQRWATFPSSLSIDIVATGLRYKGAWPE